MKLRLDWISGNRVDLLENGDVHYPAVFAAIDAAEHDVLIETFILFEDRVGLELQQHLIAAARRGVQVDLSVDGFGSSDLTEGFINALSMAGVRLHIYEPTPIVRQLNPLRRLHRKITVIDGRIAFVGGINFSEDHLSISGAKSKQDYSVRVEGPAAERIHRFVRGTLEPVQRQLGIGRAWRRLVRRDGEARDPMPRSERRAGAAGNADVAFVTRDNRHHRTDIERAYRLAIRGARDNVLIANAYFFPGYRLLRDLRRAAARGVSVELILQKDPDVPIARFAARLLYDVLLRDGVTIHEYCRREMHGKVMVVDQFWSTVGSSNLDPLSLSLNLEANVLIRDPAFAATLQRRLRHAIEHDCQPTISDAARGMTMWRYLLGMLAYHVSRGFPRWLGAIPHFGSRIRSFVRGRKIDTTATVDAAKGAD
jgi:cardiolipin synthase